MNCLSCSPDWSLKPGVKYNRVCWIWIIRLCQRNISSVFYRKLVWHQSSICCVYIKRCRGLLTDFDLLHLVFFFRLLRLYSQAYFPLSDSFKKSTFLSAFHYSNKLVSEFGVFEDRCCSFNCQVLTNLLIIENASSSSCFLNYCVAIWYTAF